MIILTICKDQGKDLTRIFASRGKCDHCIWPLYGGVDELSKCVLLKCEEVLDVWTMGTSFDTGFIKINGVEGAFSDYHLSFSKI